MLNRKGEGLLENVLNATLGTIEVPKGSILPTMMLYHRTPYYPIIPRIHGETCFFSARDVEFFFQKREATNLHVSNVSHYVELGRGCINHCLAQAYVSLLPHPSKPWHQKRFHPPPGKQLNGPINSMNNHQFTSDACSKKYGIAIRYRSFLSSISMDSTKKHEHCL